MVGSVGEWAEGVREGLGADVEGDGGAADRVQVDGRISGEPGGMRCGEGLRVGVGGVGGRHVGCAGGGGGGGAGDRRCGG